MFTPLQGTVPCSLLSHALSGGWYSVMVGWGESLVFSQGFCLLL